MHTLIFGLIAFGMFIRVTDLLEEVDLLKRKISLMQKELTSLRAETTQEQKNKED